MSTSRTPSLLAHFTEQQRSNLACQESILIEIRIVKRLSLILFFSALSQLVLFGCGQPTIEKEQQPPPMQWHYDHYKFMQHWDRLFTMETEFETPEGFRRPDSSQLTPYQLWSSYLPMWPNYRGVGSLRKSVAFRPNEISRTMHLPWRTTKFTDRVIPIQLLAEYFNYLGINRELMVLPVAGDTMTYDRWLQSKVTYRMGMSVRFSPDEARHASDSEYNRFVDLCAQNTSYKSLAANCVTVAEDEVAPGDMLITHDERGLKGKVYVVVGLVINRRKQRLYVVATGCDFGCDFHIPLIGEDRSRPWLTTEGIRALASDWPYSGFYRLKATVER